MRKRPAVALPKYVQHVVDHGRDYFYFQRGRGSKSPGPRISLPSDLHSEEFWRAYRAALGHELPTGKSFDDLIAAYRISPEFTKRAAATQRDYVRYLDIISRAWGTLLVSELRPRHVIKLRDEFAETPVAANMLLAILRLIIEWGILREFSETNPCLHVPKLEHEADGARPWPSWAYKLVDEHGGDAIRRAVLLARYTGQRQADVLRMAPEHIEDGGIVVRQQKTGKELWVPLHANLGAALGGWDSSPFVLDRKGEPYEPTRFRAAWNDLMNRTPAGKIKAEGYVFHGLRASSCEKLREAGCNDREIGAITGMSPEMITRYTRFADQRQLARAAARRLETL